MRARTYRSNNEKNEGPYDVNDYVNHLSRKAFILRRAASITYRMECISSRIHMCNQVVPHTRDHEAIIAAAPFFAACLDKPVVEATTTIVSMYAGGLKKKLRISFLACSPEPQVEWHASRL